MRRVRPRLSTRSFQVVAAWPAEVPGTVLLPKKPVGVIGGIGAMADVVDHLQQVAAW